MGIFFIAFGTSIWNLIQWHHIYLFMISKGKDFIEMGNQEVLQQLLL